MIFKTLFKRALYVFFALSVTSFWANAQADFDLGTCTKSCAAKDLEILDVYLADSEGNPITMCGEDETGSLRVVIHAGQNGNRKLFRLAADELDIVFETPVFGCGQVLDLTDSDTDDDPNGITDAGTYTLDFGTFTYDCTGSNPSLCGITLAWMTNNNSNFETCDDLVACNNYPNGQCIAIEECIPLNPMPAIMANKTARIVEDDNDDGLIDGNGEIIEYTVEVTNEGTADATNVVFKDEISTNLDFDLVVGSVIVNPTMDASITEGNTAGDDNVEVDFGTLEPGESYEITFRLSAIIDDQLEVCNQGFVSYTEGDDRVTDDPAKPGCFDPTCLMVDSGEPIIVATKTAEVTLDADNDGAADPGDEIEFTVTLTNIGSADATGLVFTDELDANLTFKTLGAISCGSKTEANNNTINTSGISLPAGGGSCSIKFTATVNDINADDNLDEICNQGFLIGDFANNPNPEGLGLPTDDPTSVLVTDTDPTCVPVSLDPNISITKTDAFLLDTDLDELADQGDQIQYTIVIMNSGPGVAENLIFEDTPGEYTSLVPGSVVPSDGNAIVELGNDGSDESIRVTNIDLGFEESISITFSVEIGTILTSDNVGEVCNQGYVDGLFANNPGGAGLPSDDPAVGGTDDLTCTPVDPSEPDELPVFGGWKLLLFGLTILALGAFFLIRREDVLKAKG